MRGELAKTDFGGLVHWKLTGEDEESAEAGAFLVNAFGAAIFLIFAVLLAQFNKLSSVFLILFAIILSTIGVFLGLMIMGQAFGIVMSGIGIIALAGIVTNNNIVLIDTYDRLRREGVPVEEAIIRTCRERARPVLLTAGAAVLGVLPIAFGVNLNFLHREITIGAPSTQWWIQLSTSIVFGLAFATILTLIVTPAQLAFIAKIRRVLDRIREAEADVAPAGGAAPAHVRGAPSRPSTRIANLAIANTRVANSEWRIALSGTRPLANPAHREWHHQTGELTCSVRYCRLAAPLGGFGHRAASPRPPSACKRRGRRSRAGGNAANCWSARTPIRITEPITAKFSDDGMPSRLTRFCRTWSRIVPSTTPTIEPSPPRSEKPPSTAAAMA